MAKRKRNLRKLVEDYCNITGYDYVNLRPSECQLAWCDENAVFDGEYHFCVAGHISSQDGYWAGTSKVAFLARKMWEEVDRRYMELISAGGLECMIIDLLDVESLPGMDNSVVILCHECYWKRVKDKRFHTIIGKTDAACELCTHPDSLLPEERAGQHDGD